ncbi:MAG: SDR family NAD(P)-dependent oxidoreductase [Eubacteriaceae bacterium]|jgi:short-subunit dehydrogenase
MENVLITGASSGIGYEFAKIFAEHGYRLILAARRPDKLETAAEKLRYEYQTEVITIPCDLSDPKAPQQLCDEIRKQGLQIDVLINNAGSGCYGLFAETDPENFHRMINLNVTGLTLLTRCVLPDMIARGSGKILNVSSLGGFQPDPYGAVYGATKAYEMMLTENLYGELIGTGVTVSALCPGPTKSEFAGISGKREARFAADTHAVAEAGYKALMRGKLIEIPTALYKLETSLIKLLTVKTRARLVSMWQSSQKHKSPEKQLS